MPTYEMSLCLVEFLLGLLETCGDFCIYQYYLGTSVDDVVLQAAAIADVLIEFVRTFLATEDEGLGMKPVTSEFYCFYFHIAVIIILIM